MWIQLDDQGRELAAILAALRLFDPTVMDIRTGSGSFPPLTFTEADNLCERINAVDPAAQRVRILLEAFDRITTPNVRRLRERAFDLALNAAVSLEMADQAREAGTEVYAIGSPQDRAWKALRAAQRAAQRALMDVFKPGNGDAPGQA